MYPFNKCKRDSSAWIVLVVSIFTLSCSHSPDISIVVDNTTEDPVAYALKSLAQSLDEQKVSYETVQNLNEARGEILLLTGLISGNGSAARLAKESCRDIPTGTEALAIWKTTYEGKPVWVVNGTDDRGSGERWKKGRRA